MSEQGGASLTDLIHRQRTGVFRVSLTANGRQVSSGSGFLVTGGLVSNAHVLPDRGYEVARLLFDEGRTAVDLPLAEVAQRKLCTSPPRDRNRPGVRRDYVYLKKTAPEFEGRHVFKLAPSRQLRVGARALYFGYPFGGTNLTAHQGSISSIHYDSSVSTHLIQIDGSVNGGNSGGPLVNPSSGLVEGLVTEAETGLLLAQMQQMIAALGRNIELFNRVKGMAAFGGIDIGEGFAASQAAVLELAKSLRRSANVGIGFAYEIDHVRDAIAALR